MEYVTTPSTPRAFPSYLYRDTPHGAADPRQLWAQLLLSWGHCGSATAIPCVPAFAWTAFIVVSGILRYTRRKVRTRRREACTRCPRGGRESAAASTPRRAEAPAHAPRRRVPATHAAGPAQPGRKTAPTWVVAPSTDPRRPEFTRQSDLRCLGHIVELRFRRVRRWFHGAWFQAALTVFSVGQTEDDEWACEVVSCPAGSFGDVGEAE